LHCVVSRRSVVMFSSTSEYGVLHWCEGMPLHCVVSRRSVVMFSSTSEYGVLHWCEGMPF